MADPTAPVAPSGDPDLEQDTGSLVPAITTILAAVAAYSAAHRTIGTTTDTVDAALGLSAMISAALLHVALRSASAVVGKARNSDERATMNEVLPKVADIAVRDGMDTLATAVRKIVINRSTGMKAIGKTQVSPAGEPWNPPVDLVPGDSDNPRILARRVAQTVRNSAVHNLAGAMPFTYRKTWHCVHDPRTRATHAFLGSPSYEFHTVDLGKPFVTIEGNLIRFPGDPLAPIEETAHCRCHITIARHD